MDEHPKSALVEHLVADKGVVAGRIEHLHMPGTSPPPARQDLLRSLPPRSDKFVGRKKELKKLHWQLAKERPVGVLAQVAVRGTGGAGKTALAVEYAWAHLEHYPGGLFFASAVGKDITPALNRIAAHLGLSDEATPEKTAAAVKARLEAGGSALLVLDNVEDVEQWRAWVRDGVLPAGPVRHLLTTTASLPAGVHPVHLGGLSSADGVKVLAGYRDDARLPANKLWAHNIVSWFDGLAVGLTVAGAYMALSEGLTWEAYARDLDKKGLEAVRGSEDAVGRLPDYHKRVYQVFDDLLDQLRPEQRRALEYAALLPEDVVVVRWLAALVAGDGDVVMPNRPGYTGRQGDAVVEGLVGQRLLTSRGEDAGILSLHRVLRRRLLERVHSAPSLQNDLLTRIADLVRIRVDAVAVVLPDAGLRWELLPLSEACGALLSCGNSLGATGPAGKLGECLREVGMYTASQRLCESVVAVCERDLSPGHPRTVAAHHELARVLSAQGDLTGARALLERVVAVCERDLAAGHPRTVLARSILAAVLRDQGDLAGARALLERVVAVCERDLVPDHPRTVAAYHELAVVLRDQGDLAGARALLERVVAVWERDFGPDHPRSRTACSTLGSVRHMQGDLAGARALFERVVAAEEQALGPGHLHTALARHDLARALYAQGDLAGARALLERVVAVCERDLAPDHPRTVLARTIFAAVMQDQGDLAGARALLERVVAVCERDVGLDHPSTVAAHHELARVLNAQGDLAGARALLERVVAVCERDVGPGHPRTVLARNNLAKL